MWLFKGSRVQTFKDEVLVKVCVCAWIYELLYNKYHETFSILYTYCILYMLQLVLVYGFVEQPFNPLPTLRHSAPQKIPWDYFPSPWWLPIFPFLRWNTYVRRRWRFFVEISLSLYEWLGILACIIIVLNRAWALLGTILERRRRSLKKEEHLPDWQPVLKKRSSSVKT